MSLAVITPELSEFWAIKNQLDLLPDFRLLEIGEKLEERVDHVLLDLSLDLFNLSVTPGYLYSIFARLQVTLASVRLKNIPLSILKSYPFSTDVESLSLGQQIIDQFINVLMDFYAAHVILMPTIISRYSLKRLYNPVLDIIQSVRMGRSSTVKMDALSRFVIIYGQDLLALLLDNFSQFKDRNIVIEGVELSLKNIYDVAQEVAGEAPIRFDRSHQISYHVPNLNALTINQVNYEFENMMIDLVDRLF